MIPHLCALAQRILGPRVRTQYADVPMGLVILRRSQGWRVVRTYDTADGAWLMAREVTPWWWRVADRVGEWCRRRRWWK